MPPHHACKHRKIASALDLGVNEIVRDSPYRFSPIFILQFVIGIDERLCLSCRCWQLHVVLPS